VVLISAECIDISVSGEKLKGGSEGNDRDSGNRYRTDNCFIPIR
jgi:hypothetical protein